MDLSMMIRNFVIFFVIFFNFVNLQSQTTTTFFPVLIDGVELIRPDTSWVSIAAGQTRTFEFQFLGSNLLHGVNSGNTTNSYSGFLTVYALFDTTTAGDGVGVVGYARPLVFDFVDKQWEMIVEPNSSDSTNIANNFNWQTNHSDDNYSISKVLNFQSCDGVLIKMTASETAPFKIRLFLKVAKG